MFALSLPSLGVSSQTRAAFLKAVQFFFRKGLAMACGGCAARGKAIRAGAHALVRGELKTTAINAKFVVKTGVSDAVSAFRARISNARSRLSKR